MYGVIFPLCHIWSLENIYEDIKIGQRDKNSRARSACPAFHFSVERSWKWFRRWWSFQWWSSQFSAALPTTTNPSLFPGSGHYLGATRNGLWAWGRGVDYGDWPSDEVKGINGNRGVGGSAKGWTKGRRGRRENKEDTPETWGGGVFTSNWVKHCVIQASVKVGERAKGWRVGEGRRGKALAEGWVGGSDGAGRGGGLTDATVQAHSTGSHSYWEVLVAGSHCPLQSKVRVHS